MYPIKPLTYWKIPYSFQLASPHSSGDPVTAAAACRELAPKVPLVFVGSDAEAWSEAHPENSRFLSIERSAVDRLVASIVEPESSAASEEADEVDAPAGH